MTAAEGAALAAAGSAALFALELAASVLLLSTTALSRVALRRLATESRGRMAFLEELRSLGSAHRAAVQAVRQGSFLGASLLAAIAWSAAGLRHPVAAGAATGLAVGVVMVETVLARLLARRDPRAALRVTALLARPAYVLTWPILAPLNAAFRHASRSMPGDDRDADDDDEVEAFIEVGERDGILEKQEGEMVRGIVDLGETLVREVMVPRTDIVALSADDTLPEARRRVLEAGHSRYPVLGEGVDEVMGILHDRDLLRAWEEGRDAGPIAPLVREAVFVPETRTVSELLREMQQKTHIALVVDEYGGLAGLVTLEDLLEEIVGDIRDEHDREEADLERQPDGTWIVSGTAHVEEIEELFGIDLGEREYDTVGGLVVSSFGRVPAGGESVESHGMRLEVLDADPRRVWRVRIHPPAPRDAPVAEPR